MFFFILTFAGGSSFVFPPQDQDYWYGGIPLPLGDLSKHPLIPIIGMKRKQKDCKYCQIHKIKSKSGLRLKTNFKCATCDVALCCSQNTERHCFILFHNEFVFGKGTNQGTPFKVKLLYNNKKKCVSC